MLKRIYVDNFRCLVNFELKLDRVNLLLGRNGTGKTTVLVHPTSLYLDSCKPSSLSMKKSSSR
jgi:predicted ATPase